MSFFRKAHKQSEMKEHPELEKAKREVTKIAKKADKQAKELNSVLVENGITLQIKIAAGGRNGH